MEFVTTEEKIIIDGEVCHTYGIRCGELYVPNVSLHEDNLARLVQRMNELKIVPYHIADVIDDWLADDNNI